MLSEKSFGISFDNQKHMRRHPFGSSYEAFIYPFLLVIAMWLVFWADHLFTNDFYKYGIRPKNIESLRGIFLMPLLHSKTDWAHIVNNSFPTLILLGTLIFNQKTSGFETRKGPIFSNIILADEINRAPSKVQSALLEAMQERQVTIGDETFLLDTPFLVLATQNPIEQEGTYPLPEAQVDRFMMKLKVDYPEMDEERQILRSSARTNIAKQKKSTITAASIVRAQKSINDIYVDEKVEDYVLSLVFATRDPQKYGLKDMVQLIHYGASPRASINLILASKARAFLEGRGYITPEDVRYIGKDILRHRIILTYEAEAEELTSEDIIQRLFDSIEIP